VPLKKTFSKSADVEYFRI